MSLAWGWENCKQGVTHFLAMKYVPPSHLDMLSNLQIVFIRLSFIIISSSGSIDKKTGN